jgi:hydroxymethylglutaryl-CoA lyase
MVRENRCCLSCRRFDGAIQGFGGCPPAKDDLTGNMPDRKLLSYFTANKENTNQNIKL